MVGLLSRALAALPRAVRDGAAAAGRRSRCAPTRAIRRELARAAHGHGSSRDRRQADLQHVEGAGLDPRGRLAGRDRHGKRAGGGLAYHGGLARGHGLLTARSSWTPGGSPPIPAPGAAAPCTPISGPAVPELEQEPAIYAYSSLHQPDVSTPPSGRAEHGPAPHQHETLRTPSTRRAAPLPSGDDRSTPRMWPPWRLQSGALAGVDFDASMCRFATMNYLLSTGLPFDSPPPVTAGNSLAQNDTSAPTVIVCNPPFRSTAPLPAGRIDLWERSPSMQLNFLQHIARTLPIGGRAAVFVPDSILFGTGADRTVRLRLLQEYDVHTLLRLPTGVFAHGNVKVNVVFFDAVRPRADGAAVTRQVWIYDFRSGRHFAATQNPLLRADLDDFVESYGHGRPRTQRIVTGRFRPVSYEQLAAQDFNLDILWPGERASAGTRSPKEIAQEIVDELSAAVDEFAVLAEELPDDPLPVSGDEVR